MFIHEYIDKQNVVYLYGVSLMAQLVKTNKQTNKPACNARDPGLILGQEVPLKKGWVTHSSIHRLPWWLRQ